MRIIIDVNALVDGDFTNSTVFTARPGAQRVVQKLIEQGNDMVYYTDHDGLVAWVEQHFPCDDVVLYHDTLDKLTTLYERECERGPVALIDASYQETIAEFHRLVRGEHAAVHPNGQEVASWLSQYLILIAACGPRIVVDSVLLTVMLWLEDWQDAGEILRAFGDQR